MFTRATAIAAAELSIAVMARSYDEVEQLLLATPTENKRLAAFLILRLNDWLPLDSPCYPGYQKGIPEGDTESMQKWGFQIEVKT